MFGEQGCWFEVGENLKSWVQIDREEFIRGPELPGDIRCWETTVEDELESVGTESKFLLWLGNHECYVIRSRDLFRWDQGSHPARCVWNWVFFDLCGVQHQGIIQEQDLFGWQNIQGKGQYYEHWTVNIWLNMCQIQLWVS